MFNDRSNFAIFEKGSPKEHSFEIISKSDLQFQRRRFLNNNLKKFHFVTVATTVFDGINFCEQLLKTTSEGTILPSLVQIGPVVWEEKLFNPFPNKPWFLCVYSTSLSKTLWEEEKLLVRSNFSFSHSVFYPFGYLSAIFIKS